MKKKLLLIGYRAYGDWLYALPILPYLFEKYDVYLETTWKGYELFHDDPRFKEVAIFPIEAYTKDQYDAEFTRRWEECRKAVQPDVELNLNGTLEVRCIAENFQEEFYLPVEERRKIFGELSFYEAVFERVGIPVPAEPKLDCLYYPEEAIKFVEQWRETEKGKFVVILSIAGSTSQKVVHNYEAITSSILNRWPDAVVYLAGDPRCKPLVPAHPRIKNMCQPMPIKQSILMTKYADMVIGPETGLLVAAGMWGTPKIMMCTTSSIEQCCKFHKNDYSMQAPIWCSPCHRAIYYDTDCHEMRGDVEKKVLFPACSKTFKTEDILNKVGLVYEQRRSNL